MCLGESLPLKVWTPLLSTGERNFPQKEKENQLLKERREGQRSLRKVPEKGSGTMWDKV
jgi:hypothetical protein